MTISAAFQWFFAAVFVATLPVTYAATEAKGSSKEMGEFSGGKTTEYPSWFKQSFLDFTDDVNEAAAAGKRVMVLFEQEGCPYCHALVNRNLSQKDIEQFVRKHFDAVMVNIWGDREVMTVGGKPYTEKTFSEALKVQFTPTVIFFNEKGKLVLRLNGYLPPDKFKVALNYVANKKEKEMTYREFVKANEPKQLSGDLNKQAFFGAPPYNLKVKSNPGKPIAVFFEQPQCPNCDALHSEVLIDEETQLVIDNFTSVQLDMWSDTPVITPDGKKTTAREWAKQLDVKYAPSIVLFNREGKEIIRSEAFFKTFHTQGLFAYVFTDAYKEQPNFQRYLSDRAEQIREHGTDVNIWK